MKTSITHPILVNWIHGTDTTHTGRVGLTFAPGKQAHGIDGHWHRDLVVDIDRLVDVYDTKLLVCLLQDSELQMLNIPDYVEVAERRVRVLRLPIPDGGVLADVADVHVVVDEIHRVVDAGDTVVIHCRGGLGRAGTIGGCYLKARGLDDGAVFAALRARHATKCPETNGQRDFIRAYEPATKDKTLHDRIAGAVLGAAIGDAMGNPTEFMSMREIHARYGDDGVTGFTKWSVDDNGQRVAPYTDDTQMNECVIRTLLDVRGDRNVDVDVLMTLMAKRFVRWSTYPQGGHRAPGNACMSGCRALARGVPWREAGGATAGGCGSVMRAWPFGLVFHDAAENLAVAHSRLTHNDPIALAACAAIAVGVSWSMRGALIADLVEQMEHAASHFNATTAAMIQRAADEAFSGVGPEVTLDRLRLGRPRSHRRRLRLRPPPRRSTRGDPRRRQHPRRQRQHRQPRRRARRRALRPARRQSPPTSRWQQRCLIARRSNHVIPDAPR